MSNGHLQLNCRESAILISATEELAQKFELYRPDTCVDIKQGKKFITLASPTFNRVSAEMDSYDFNAFSEYLEELKKAYALLTNPHIGRKDVSVLEPAAYNALIAASRMADLSTSPLTLFLPLGVVIEQGTVQSLPSIDLQTSKLPFVTVCWFPPKTEQLSHIVDKDGWIIHIPTRIESPSGKWRRYGFTFYEPKNNRINNYV